MKPVSYLALVTAAVTILAHQAAAQVTEARRDSAQHAFSRGLMALSSTGVDRFAGAHPTWDGRGVLIAILDTGIDPSIPGIAVGSGDSPRIIDLRDFSGEGRIALRRAIRRGDTVMVAGHALGGATHLLAATGRGEGALWTGILVETSLGLAPAADVNGDGTIADTLALVVGHTRTGWALFVDATGRGSFDDAKPIHDFAIARETFGWHRARANGLPPAPASLIFAANFADSADAPLLDLFFDTGEHGTHVTGIAAGHDLYGVAGFDGVAPGASILGLKISDNAHGPLSVTGSMERAVAYAIATAKAHAMPLVINMSFGVGSEIEGTARIDRALDSILAANPGVVMAIAAGNDGPGLGTIGFPGTASRIISVGASLPAAFIPRTDANGNAVAVDTLERVAEFSARGGEVAAPDLVAPGTAYSSVPNFAIGDELESGTSMATPYVSGLAARLLSAELATRLGQRDPAMPPPSPPPTAAAIRLALIHSARPLPGATPSDEGAGLPDLETAWRWLRTHRTVPNIAVDIARVRGRGGIYLATAPGAGPDSVAVSVSMRRLDGVSPITVRLRSTAPWITAPPQVTLHDGQAGFVVHVHPAPLHPGASFGTLMVESTDATVGLLRTIPVTVRVADPSVNPVTTALPATEGVARTFFAADTGRGMHVTIATDRTGERAIALLHEPGGMPFRGSAGTAVGHGDDAGSFDIDASDAIRGIYEVDVASGPLPPAPAHVTVLPAPIRLGAFWRNDTLTVNADNLSAEPLALRIRAGLLGAEHRVSLSPVGSAPVRIALRVPSWSRHLELTTTMPLVNWSRFTDLGVTTIDATGRELSNNPVNYAFSRASITLPDSLPGDSVTIVLTPGFADRSVAGPWPIELTVRWYVRVPYSLDQGGSSVKPLAAHATRIERFAQSSDTLPVAIPTGYTPLITVVGVEGENVWTRRLAIRRSRTPR